jgi:hypothetical protein
MSCLYTQVVWDRMLRLKETNNTTRESAPYDIVRRRRCYNDTVPSCAYFALAEGLPITLFLILFNVEMLTVIDVNRTAGRALSSSRDLVTNRHIHKSSLSIRVSVCSNSKAICYRTSCFTSKNRARCKPTSSWIIVVEDPPDLGVEVRKYSSEKSAVLYHFSRSI